MQEATGRFLLPSAFFIPEAAPVTSAVWLALGAMLLLGLVDQIDEPECRSISGSHAM